MTTMRATRRLRMVLTGLGASLGLIGTAAGLAIVTGQEAADAAVGVRVVNTDGQGVSSRSAPQVGARNGYGAPEGAAVTANCWTWGESVGPNNNRLWWQISYRGRNFYASDRYLSTPNIANQPPAGQPQCGAAAPAPTPAPALSPTSSVSSRAVGWARAQVGKAYAAGPDAAPYRDWAPGPYGEWSGDCIKFVHRAYAVAGVGVPNGDAIVVYRVYHAQGRIRQGTPPAGALVFWDTARPYGHVALSIGGGQVIGTRGMDFARLPIQQYSTGTIPGYLGWAMP